MEPITLAVVTTAVVTLALDAAKEMAPQVAKDTWSKFKGWLGWTKTPPTEDLANEIAVALTANTQAAEQIVTELKKSDTGAASRLASKINITVTNTTGNINAGRDAVNIQGQRNVFGPGTRIGGG